MINFKGYIKTINWQKYAKFSSVIVVLFFSVNLGYVFFVMKPTINTTWGVYILSIIGNVALVGIIIPPLIHNGWKKEGVKIKNTIKENEIETL